MKTVIEQVMEIRYTPRASIVNKIGEIADDLVADGQFKFWRMDPGKLALFDTEDEALATVRGVVTFRNAAISVSDPVTPNYFRDKALAFWSRVSAKSRLGDPSIQRVGIRTKVFFPVDRGFVDIERDLATRFFRQGAFDFLGGNREDFQIVVELSHSEYMTKLTLGPMQADEAESHFKKKSELMRNCGIYVDVDAYVSNLGTDRKRLEKFVRAASEKTLNTCTSIADATGS